MTPNELKQALEGQGWRVERTDSHTGVPWYAWRRLSDVVDCTSNEKAPGFILQPWEHVSDTHTWRSVEFEICGEVGDVWLKLKAYTIPMDDALAMWPRCEAVLKAAWNAAANLPRVESEHDAVKS